MANIAIFRINYKSDFILTLNSDAGWMTPFCIKFWTGAPSQAYFVGYDGTTYTHCAPVDGEPTKLLVQFDDHHLPIGDLKFQIGYHFTVADFPTSVEDEVVNQAAVIIDQDGTPMQVMLDLNGETAPEIQFSLPAYANEAQRIANEESRIVAETIRQQNETQRINNEAQRIRNEEARIAEFAQMKAEAIEATDAANSAAALANEKAALAADKAALAAYAAQLANDKAALSQAAAQLANDKAQLAADKAALAQAASQLCDEKATLAQQKATYAQQQGDYSKAQGDYAKEQGDYSKAQGDYSKEQGDYSKEQGDYAKDKGDICADDHQTAVADHQTATADHQTAAADHQTATTDHNQAGNDHTRAESDHTRAESDHAAVEVYVDSLGAFDISAYHATGGVLAKYADLTAALGTNGANIPDVLRKGGMSIKFVHSVYNKYVQFRCMAQNFTTDVAKWSFCGDDVLIENNYWVKVVTDKSGRIVCGIKNDGDFHFGAGVPQQIKDYIQSKISELSLDEYQDIVDFVGNLISGDKTLQQLLNEKVDKVDGKSLINSDYADSQDVIENSFWSEVTKDSKGKLLNGRKNNGTVVEYTPHVFNGDVEGKNFKIDNLQFENSTGGSTTVDTIEVNEEIVLSAKAKGKLEEELNLEKRDVIPYNDVIFTNGRNIKIYNPYKDGGSHKYAGQMHCHSWNYKTYNGVTYKVPIGYTVEQVAAMTEEERNALVLSVNQEFVAFHKTKGFSFMTITNYDNFADYTEAPATMPENFIWLGNGFEANTGGYDNTGQAEDQGAHIVVINTNFGKIFEGWNKNEVIKYCQDRNCICDYAHPFLSALYSSPNYVKEIKNGIRFIEVYNGFSMLHADIAPGVPSIKSGIAWDEDFDALLTQGNFVFCTSVSDGRTFNNNIVHGCIFVFADSLSHKSIIDAMLNGNFYASTDIRFQINGVSINDSGLMSVDVGQEGATVEFVKENNTVITTVTTSAGNTVATYQLSGEEKFVRARVSMPDDVPNVFYKKIWTQAIRLSPTIID